MSGADDEVTVRVPVGLVMQPGGLQSENRDCEVLSASGGLSMVG